MVTLYIFLNITKIKQNKTIVEFILGAINVLTKNFAALTINIRNKWILSFYILKMIRTVIIKIRTFNYS